MICVVHAFAAACRHFEPAGQVQCCSGRLLRRSKHGQPWPAMLTCTACRMRLPLCALCVTMLIATVSTAPSLTANITSLSSNSQVVSVTATGVAQPSSGDAIALVIPANTTNYTATPPQKFKWVETNGSSTYLSTGNGTVT